MVVVAAPGGGDGLVWEGGGAAHDEAEVSSFRLREALSSSSLPNPPRLARRVATPACALSPWVAEDASQIDGIGGFGGKGGMPCFP